MKFDLSLYRSHANLSHRQKLVPTLRLKRCSGVLGRSRTRCKMGVDTEDANLERRGFHRYTSRKYEKIGGVLELPWVQDLLKQEDTSSVLTAGAMVSKDSLLPADHMVTDPMPRTIILAQCASWTASRRYESHSGTFGKGYALCL